VKSVFHTAGVIVVALVTLAARNQSNHSIPAWVSDLGYHANELAPLTVGPYGFPYLEVVINDSHFEFAFDTGNMSGLLISPQVAAECGLQPVDTSTHYDSAGNTVAVKEVFEIHELVAFGSTWGQQVAHEYSLAGVPGLIGPRFLIGRRFTLDYRAGLMAVSNSPLPKASTAAVLELIRSPEHEALILVKGLVNGRATVVEIDTGKSRTVVDPTLISDLDLPRTEDGVQIDEIRIGMHRFSASSAKKKSFKGISRGLEVPIGIGVGSDILSRLIVTVDYRQRALLLQHNPESN
jgi:predicted aspartyl protease